MNAIKIRAAAAVAAILATAAMQPVLASQPAVPPQVVGAIPEPVQAIMQRLEWHHEEDVALPTAVVQDVTASGIRLLDVGKNSQGNVVVVDQEASGLYVLSTYLGDRHVRWMTVNALGSVQGTGEGILAPPRAQTMSESPICGDAGIVIGLLVFRVPYLGFAYTITQGLLCLAAYVDPLQASTHCEPSYCVIDTAQFVGGGGRLRYSEVQGGTVVTLRISNLPPPNFRWYSMRTDALLENLYMYGLTWIDRGGGSYDASGVLEIPSFASYITNCTARKVLVHYFIFFSNSSTSVDAAYGVPGNGQQITGDHCQND